MRTLFTCLLAVLAMLNAAASRADAQAAFARMRSLVGEWRAPLSNNETMIDIFRPIAFGTALLHEEWKNGEQLTATVFYVVGSELRADHYCDMGNQLHYVDESTDPQVLRFVLKDASNLDTHPHHFHSTTWRYGDADHHVQDWEAMTPGKPSKTIRMDFTRVAAANVDPQAVVRADVQALNDGNSATLLSLFAADARIFRTSRDPDRLIGDLSDKMGTQEQRKSFFGEMLARKRFATAVNARDFGRMQTLLPPRQKLRILVCHKDGRPVSGLVASTIGRTGIYLLGATNDEGMQHKGSYLLQWRLMQWLKEQGAEVYDLGGIDPDANPGVFHFKKGLSGLDTSLVGTFEAVSNRAAGSIVRACEALARVILRHRRRV